LIAGRSSSTIKVSFFVAFAPKDQL